MEVNMRERAIDTSFVSNARPKKRAAGAQKPDVIRVLVVEDHTVVRDGLVAIIKQQTDMDVVAETGDGQQEAELWKKHRPDITLFRKLNVLSRTEAIAVANRRGLLRM